MGNWDAPDNNLDSSSDDDADAIRKRAAEIQKENDTAVRDAIKAKNKYYRDSDEESEEVEPETANPKKIKTKKILEEIERGDKIAGQELTLKDFFKQRQQEARD